MADFYPRSDQPGKYTSACKQCSQARTHTWQVHNAATIREARLRAYIPHPKQKRSPEARRAADREWHMRNSAEVNERRRARIVERYGSQYKYAVARGYIKPEIKREQNRRYKARREGAAGFISAKDWADLVDACKGVCALCGLELPLTLDHIIPLALGGTNEITNAQPLCLHCNSSKHTRAVDYRPREVRLAYPSVL